MRIILLGLLFLILSTLLNTAQAQKAKWGKLPSEDLEMTVYQNVPKADAVILSDFGEVSLANSGNNSFIFKRHTRIKILSAAGLKWANVSLDYYHLDNTEFISNIKGITYNLNDGKEVKSKLLEEELSDEKLNDEWAQISFTMPDVQVGSVIEYSYYITIKEVINLKSWQFQTTIPTRHSQFEALIPVENEMTTNVSVKVNQQQDDFLAKRKPEFTVIFQGNRLVSKYGQRGATNQWILSNLPAIKEEPFIYNPQDFVEQLNFQLASYRIKVGLSDLKRASLMPSWNALARELSIHPSFAIPKGKLALVQAITDSLTAAADNDLAKMKVIYSHVQQDFKWEGQYNIWRNQSFKQLLETQKGNSAEVNTYLLMLLRTAGLTAHPLILSTKSHGLVMDTYPLLSSFNHVITEVQIAGKSILLDATDPFRPYQYLSKEDLNQKGYLIANSPRWVKLESKKTDKQSTAVAIKFNDLASLDVKVESNFQNYFAIEQRHNYQAASDKNDYFEATLNDKITAYTLDSTQIEHLTDLDKSFKTYLQATIPLTNAAESPDSISLLPFLFNEYQVNPFTAPTREFPIDYVIPFEKSYRFTIEIPDGYEADTVPEPGEVNLLGGLGKFTYKVVLLSDKINISTKIKINSSLIDAWQYALIKKFYQNIVEKFGKQLILKKV